MTEDYAPYVPPAPMFQDPPAAGKPVLPPAPVHEKKVRKKRPAKSGADKPKAEKIPPNIFKKKRKKRTVVRAGLNSSVSARVAKMKPIPPLKLDVGLAMAISVDLKSTDFQMFEVVVQYLRTVPKAARARILAAVGRVFA